MGVDESFLSPGDVIEVCGFAWKAEVLKERGPAPSSIHGHMLVMPDGQMRPWGPYGRLDNCVRPTDQRQSWLDFLNSDPIAKDLWCAKHRAWSATIAASRELAAEIDSLMANPCG
jgi:hypothetical protein